uniref:Uncharacterized protein n=1 Tax=Schizaphis graminum TaxID=13262 RepID=A0A2S2PS93_SCHGA
MERRCARGEQPIRRWEEENWVSVMSEKGWKCGGREWVVMCREMEREISHANNKMVQTACGSSAPLYVYNIYIYTCYPPTSLCSPADRSTGRAADCMCAA